MEPPGELVAAEDEARRLRDEAAEEHRRYEEAEAAEDEWEGRVGSRITCGVLAASFVLILASVHGPPMLAIFGGMLFGSVFGFAFGQKRERERAERRQLRLNSVSIARRRYEEASARVLAAEESASRGRRGPARGPG